MGRSAVPGFPITEQDDLRMSLDELLMRINFRIGIGDLNCCLKHLSIQYVLLTLRNMMKQRCDHSFTPSKYKQCINCDLMAEEDEELCWGCESAEFRLAKPTVMSL